MTNSCTQYNTRKDKGIARPHRRGNATHNHKGELRQPWLNIHDGYIKVYSPYTQSNRSEHRILAEKALGRPLTDNEIVHHIDGDRTNNKNTNLLICTRKYHQWLHGRMSYLYQQLVFGCAKTN